ncbi:MAG: DegT/DnrJ/EryC1/StrS family aminotransferase [Elusimicrobia bacterium]|nr:DegT/DnrJ/EryC1/StrS family aminotransferase [Elusimicrobiota bacterium]
MKVPYSYLSRQFADPGPILEEIRRLVASGDFTLGDAVVDFERRFAALIGTKQAVGVGSGTDALFLTLKALGVGPGHEVITAANTFVATAGAIETAGARIVFVDCDDRLVIDPDRVEQAITPRTRAIVPVHWGGQPAAMGRVMELAKRQGIHVVEDACQAIGAAVGGLQCGSIGAAGAFSLHPLKNLNVWGDGGIITTNDDAVAERLRLLRNHGMSNRDEYAFFAYNSRLDSLQAVVGNWLMKDIEWITETRIANARRLDEALAGLAPAITLPRRDPAERHVYHLYQFLAKDRDRLHDHLRQNGIEAKIHYPRPLHLQPAARHLGYRPGSFPNAEAQARSLLTLPVHQHLTVEELAYMIATIREFYR